MTTCWGLPNPCTMWVSFHESRSTVTDVPAFWQGPRDPNFKYPPFSYAKKDHKVSFFGNISIGKDRLPVPCLRGYEYPCKFQWFHRGQLVQDFWNSIRGVLPAVYTFMRGFQNRCAPKWHKRIHPKNHKVWVFVVIIILGVPPIYNMHERTTSPYLFAFCLRGSRGYQ